MSSMQITESGADTGIVCMILLVNADTPNQHAPQGQHESYVDAAVLVKCTALVQADNACHVTRANAPSQG